MADPKAWQILEALKARLAAIVGDGGASGYRYTPDAVHIEEAWTDDILNPTLAVHPVIYVIVPAEREKTPLTYTHIRGEMRLDVVALRHAPDEGTPYKGRPDPSRVEIRERLAADAERCVRGANSCNGGDNLGGLSIYCDVTDIETSAEEVYEPVWAVAFLRVVVTYAHPDLTP